MKKYDNLPMKDTKLIFPLIDHHPIVRSPIKSHFRRWDMLTNSVSFGFCPVKIHAMIDDVQEIRVKKREKPRGFEKENSVHSFSELHTSTKFSAGHHWRGSWRRRGKEQKYLFSACQEGERIRYIIPQ